MGLCLSFLGSLPDRRARRAALEFASAFATDNEWTATPVSISRPKATLAGRPLSDVRVEGVSLLPHFACEPLPLLFLDGPGTLVDLFMKDEGDDRIGLTAEPIVKTHFAGAAVHDEVCRFLRELRERFLPNLRVDDESGYFADPDRERLARALDTEWTTILGEIAADLGAMPFELGGFQIVPAEAGPPAEEFAALTPEQRDAVLRSETWLLTRYGGFGTTLDRSRASVADLDLLMSDADDEHYADRGEDEDVVDFAGATGAHFGRILVQLLGGFWTVDEEEGLQLRDVGGIGLRVNPFDVAAARVGGGPPHDFERYLEVFEEFRRRLLR